MTTIIQKRNIVVLGKTGAGKSSVANKITGTETFNVSSSIQSVTKRATHTEVEVLTDSVKYTFKVVDTVGLFDTVVSNYTVIEDVKRYFQDKVSEGVNLVLFVFKNGRFTKEEKESFDFIINKFNKEISDVSALVITGCEDLDDKGRASLIEEFSTNSVTAPIAKFMGKGIHPVGFPRTEGMKNTVRVVYEEDMKADVAALRILVMKAGEMRLSKEMFQEKFWEKCNIL